MAARRWTCRQLNVLVAGGTGEGKSYVAGLVAEQLIGLGYTLVVVDPEGDHAGLGRLRGLLVTGGDSFLLPAAEVTALIRQRNLSVVVDLSGLDLDGQARCLREVPVEVEAQRRATGRHGRRRPRPPGRHIPSPPLTPPKHRTVSAAARDLRPCR